MMLSEKGTAAMVKNLRSEGSESRATYLELMQNRINALEQQLKAAKEEGMREAFRRGFIECFIHLDSGTCTYKEQNESIRVSNLKADEYANSLEGK